MYTHSTVAHEFDPKVAKVYGINAALVFQHIAYLSQESPNRWVDLMLPELCEKYPYLGRDQIWRALRTLTTQGPKAPPLVLRKAKAAGIGHLYAPIPQDGFCDLPHKFDIALAAKLGVVPAIIYRNIRYWVQKNWMIRAEQVYEKLKPEQFDWDEKAMQVFAYANSRKAASHFCTVDQWVERHDYVRRSSAFLGFSRLLEEGLLLRSTLPNKIPLWTLPAKTLDCFKRMLLKECDLSNCSPETKLAVQKPNSRSKNQTADPETKRPNRDDLLDPESDESNSVSVKSSNSEAEFFASRKESSVQHNYDDPASLRSFRGPATRSGGRIAACSLPVLRADH